MPVDPAVVSRACEDAWLTHWSRLVALLVRQYRRIDLVEDALGEAFARAAVVWARDGLPDNPPAWLVTTARRRLIDLLRAEAVAARKRPLLVVGDVEEPTVDGDDELRLILLCCHPALAPESRVALAMRLVLGLPTDDVARLFLVSPATMAARLTRAKRKIVDAGIPLPTVAGAGLHDRLDHILRTVYLAFTAGYAPSRGDAATQRDLSGEAIRLGRLVQRSAPRHPGPRALLALVLFQHSRRDAREDAEGLVVLAEQDRTRWHDDEIVEARQLIADVEPSSGFAEELRLQALIAECHAVAPTARQTDWRRIDELYQRLIALTGSPVAVMNRAVAVSEWRGPHAALAIMEAVADLDDQLGRTHRLPAVRGELLARTDDRAGAAAAFTTAIDRCPNDLERAHLVRRRATVE